MYAEWERDGGGERGGGASRASDHPHSGRMYKLMSSSRSLLYNSSIYLIESGQARSRSESVSRFIDKIAICPGKQTCTNWYC